MYTYDLANGERLPIEVVEEIVAKNANYSKIKKYKTYFNGVNPEILKKYNENLLKGITPNKTVTSPYPYMLANTASGYCFSNIVRSDREDDTIDNANFIDDLKAVMLNNDADVVDKKNGLRQLGIGVSYIMHWVDKDGGDTLRDQLRFAVVDTPENCIPVYSSDISRKLVAFVYVQMQQEDKIAKIYYPDAIQTLNMQTKFVSEDKNEYGVIPVEVYWNSDTIGEVTPVYSRVMDLINLVDHILTGQFNEIERFKNAILSLAKSFKPEDKANVHLLQLLDNMGDDWDKIKFITKEVPVEFQKWVYESAVREIHKQTGIIDFFDPEGGITSATSAKAMQTRMLTMNMNADSWELYNRSGQYQRLRIIGGFLEYKNSVRSINIEYNRVTINDFFENAQKANGLTNVSLRTVHEYLGLDSKEEAERLKAESESNTSEIARLLRDTEASASTDE